jgi:hypothetical protein
MVIFICPTRQDLLLMAILEQFEQADGLKTNLEKCKATPINFSPEQSSLPLDTFGFSEENFPMSLLGNSPFGEEVKML